MLRLAVLGVDLALIGAVGVFAWAQARPEREPDGTAAPMSAPERREQAREVSAALDRLAADPQALVADASRDDVGGDARAAVPPGSKVETDAASWKPDGVGGGVMRVTITPPGASATTYAAVMVEEADGWKVLATFPVGDAPEDP